MNNPTTIQRFLSLLSIATLILFTAWMTVPGSALVSEDIEIEIDGTQSYLCGQIMKAEGDELIAQYTIFLDAQTKDASDNSDRLDQVMSFYRYVLGTLDDVFEESVQEDLAGETVASSSDEYEYCRYVKDQYVLIADTMLRTYYISSTGSKLAFTVVDGLKAMNTDLQDMSPSFHATFPGMFNKFSNAFPCYIKSCVSR
jgi:hypothetical protein